MIIDHNLLSLEKYGPDITNIYGFIARCFLPRAETAA